MEVKIFILLVLSLMINSKLSESSSLSYFGDCIVRDCPSGYYFSFISCGCKIWESLSIPTLFPSTSKRYFLTASSSSEEESSLSSSEVPSSSESSNYETQISSSEQSLESPSSSDNPSSSTCDVQCADPLVRDQVFCLCTCPDILYCKYGFYVDSKTGCSLCNTGWFTAGSSTEQTSESSSSKTSESPSSSDSPSSSISSKCDMKCADPLVQDEISCLCTIPSPSYMPSTSQTGYEPTTQEFSSSFSPETPSSNTPSTVCLNSCSGNYKMNLNTCECVCPRQNCPSGYYFEHNECLCIRHITHILTSDTNTAFLTSSPDIISDTPTPSETPSRTCYSTCPLNYYQGRDCECYCDIHCYYPFVTDYDNCKCKCDPNIVCPTGCALDPNLCLCFPPSCPQYFTQDPETNECVCDQNYHLNCSYNQKWDNQTCHCACAKSEVCEPGFVFDQTLCLCVCEPKICENNFKHNQDNCECECDLNAVNRSCPSGYIFSYVTCQCEAKLGGYHPSGC